MSFWKLNLFHTTEHQLIYQQTPEEFHADITKGLDCPDGQQATKSKDIASNMNVSNEYMHESRIRENCTYGLMMW
ncbi:MAG: hypothetical protein LBS55_07790 [Prevotellaceae bacterium]|nr:hypothetical protein [Prevotellaceae bacterium]